ncbi:ORF1 [Thelephora terrestris virus 1]|uniref:ORF1 n=1 Tax=Thelephora terrestris virus 1 TaxID=1770613 RepID=A0A0U3B651_9VIRU|nr:ORF1 [Thelephora terrestris virus 1]ALT08063.1 ORF1 [Thelephora terrestris virus 1]
MQDEDCLWQPRSYPLPPAPSVPAPARDVIVPGPRPVRPPPLKVWRPADFEFLPIINTVRRLGLSTFVFNGVEYRVKADCVGLVGVETNPGPIFPSAGGLLPPPNQYELGFVVLAPILVLFLFYLHFRVRTPDLPKAGSFIGRSLSWAGDTRKTVFQSWIVTRGEVLLTTRGPASSGADFVNTTSGVGGSAEKDESPSDTLTREAKEEVGIDINGADVQVGHTEVRDDCTIVWCIVYLDSQQEPLVPAAEKDKVISPRWVAFADVDTSSMHPSTAVAYSQCAKFFMTGARYASCSSKASATWLRRGDSSDMPPGAWSLVLVNNYDGLCVPYAMQAVSGVEFDFVDLAARVPRAGYDFRQLASNPDEWAMWSADEKRWVYGVPEKAKYFLFHKMNGSFGHVDGLKPLAIGEPVLDSVFYPQGRGDIAIEGCRDEYIHYALSAASMVDTPAQKADVYRDKVKECLAFTKEDVEIFLAGWYAANLNGGKGPSPQTPPRAPTPGPLFCCPDCGEEYRGDVNGNHPSCSQAGLDNVRMLKRQQEMALEEESRKKKKQEKGDPLARKHNQRTAGASGSTLNMKGPDLSAKSAATEPPLRLTASLDIVGVVEDKRIHEIPIHEDDLFSDITAAATEISFGPSSEGYSNLGRLLLSDSVTEDIFIETEPGHGTMSVEYRYKDRMSEFPATEIVSFVSRNGRHTQVAAPNVVPGDYADKFSTTVKEFGYIYSQITGGGAQILSRMSNWVTTVDEVPAASYAEYYHRLWSGWLAVATNSRVCAVGNRRAINGHGGGTVDPHFTAVFPNNLSFEDMFGLSNGPVQGWPKVDTIDATSDTCLIPIRIPNGPRFPPVTGGNNPRDFRVVLYHLGKPYMDLQSPAEMQLGGRPRTNANLQNAPSFWSHFDARIPHPVFLCDTIDLARNNNGFVAYDANALNNPDSWRDAIVFMLQAVGGSSECMNGLQSTIELSYHFFTGDVTHLSSPIQDRTVGGLLTFDALRKRLLYLRVLRPFSLALANNQAATRGDRQAVEVFKILCAQHPAGSPLCLDILTANPAAPGWAVVQDMFGAAAGAAVLPGATLQDCGALNNNIVADALWHQYFVNVSLDGAGSPDLHSFVSTMPQADWYNCRAWLDEDIFANYPAAIVFPAAQAPELIAPLNYDNGQVRIPEDDEKYDRLTRGLDLPTHHVLPLFNMHEHRMVTLPNGSGAVRNSKVSTNVYHDDKVAHVLARRLHNPQFTTAGLIERTVLAAIQLRAGTDSVAAKLNLNASAIFLRTGMAVTGVPAIDAVLEDTNEYVKFGQMREFHHNHVELIAHAALNAGYPCRAMAEFGSVRRYEFAPVRNFEYDIGLHPTPDAPLLIWRCLHPITIGFFRPDIVSPETVISKELELMGIYTPGAQLPWEDWVLEGEWRRPTSALGALRVVLSVSGLRIKVTPMVDFLPTRGRRRPTEFPVLEYPGSAIPRYGTIGCASPVLKLDPLVWYHCPLPYRLRVEEDANHQLQWLGSAPIFEYSPSVRANGLPPLVTYLPQMVKSFAGTTAAPNPASLIANATGRQANGSIGRVDYIYYGGESFTGPNYYYADNDSLPTILHRFGTQFFSQQHSANKVFMRSPQAIIASCAGYRTTRGAVAAAPIQGADGVAAPNNYCGGAMAGCLIDSRSCHLSTICFGDLPAPGATAADVLSFFYMNMPATLHKWEKWYLKPQRMWLPIILSGRYEIATLTLPGMVEGTLNDTGTHSLADSALARTIGGFKSARGSEFYPESIANPTPGRIQNFDPEMMSFPLVHGHQDHFLTGFGAGQIPMTTQDSFAQYEGPLTSDGATRAKKRLRTIINSKKRAARAVLDTIPDDDMADFT